MAKPAKWIAEATETLIEDDGTSHTVVALSDGRKRQGSLIVDMTADRHLRVEWRSEPGTPQLAGFEAWSVEPT